MLRSANETGRGLAETHAVRTGFLLIFLLISLLFLGCAQPSQQMQPTPSAPKTPSTWQPDGVINEGEYQNHKSFGKIEVYWKRDGEFLYMAVKGQTRGWVAVGFGPSVAMKDADMVMAWVENGEVKAVDAFSTGTFGPHPPDTELGGRNDLLEVGGKEEKGVTIVEFKRKLNTGDKYDKILTPGEVVRIIWAMADSDDFAVKHVARGGGEIVI